MTFIQPKLLKFFKDWFERSVVNKIVVIGITGLVLAIVVNMFLLNVPLRAVFEEFLTGNQREIEDIQKVSASLSEVQQQISTTISQVTDENAEVLLADVKKNLDVHLNVFSKQVREALDQVSEYLIREQALGLVENTDISNVIVKTKKSVIEVSRDAQGKVVVSNKSRLFSEKMDEFKSFTGMRQRQSEGRSLLEGVVQIAEHDATIAIHLDIASITQKINDKKIALSDKMNSIFSAGTLPLIEKVAQMSKNSHSNSDRVKSRVSGVIALIFILDSLILWAGVWVTLKMSRKMIQPLQSLVNAAGQLSSGNFEVKFEQSSRDEVGVLSQCFEKMSVSLKASYLDQKRLNHFTREVSAEHKEQEVFGQLHNAFCSILGLTSVAYVKYMNQAGSYKSSIVRCLVRNADESFSIISMESPEAPDTWKFCQPKVESILKSAVMQQGISSEIIPYEEGNLLACAIVLKDKDLPIFGMIALDPERKQWNPFFCDIFESIAHTISMVLERINNEEIVREVGQAQMIQDLLMSKPKLRSDINVEILYHQASCGGGDWFFYEEINKQLVFIIADVTGHGVPASLLTAFGRGCTSTLASLMRNPDGEASRMQVSPSELLNHLATNVYAATQGRIGMTAFALVLDLERRQITYANAGHNFPILHKVDSIVEELPVSEQKRKNSSFARNVSRLIISGERLGFCAATIYRSKISTVEAGDRIILFTDGLTECRNPQDKEYGEIRLKKVVSETGNMNPKEALAHLEKDVFEFIQGCPLPDDLMIVIIEVPKSSSKISLVS